MEESGFYYTSSNGTVTKVSKLNDGHLQNIIAKMEREGVAQADFPLYDALRAENQRRIDKTQEVAEAMNVEL